MLVYRVESPNGFGPYCREGDVHCSKHSNKLESMWDSHNNGDYHPTGDWDVDKGSRVGCIDEYRHGFLSLKQLNGWFYGFRTLLKKLSYNVAVYDVDERDCDFGMFQLRFDSDKAKLVKKLVIK